MWFSSISDLELIHFHKKNFERNDQKWYFDVTCTRNQTWKTTMKMSRLQWWRFAGNSLPVANPKVVLGKMFSYMLSLVGTEDWPNILWRSRLLKNLIRNMKMGLNLVQKKQNKTKKKQGQYRNEKRTRHLTFTEIGINQSINNFLNFFFSLF